MGCSSSREVIPSKDPAKASASGTPVKDGAAGAPSTPGEKEAGKGPTGNSNNGNADGSMSNSNTTSGDPPAKQFFGTGAAPASASASAASSASTSNGDGRRRGGVGAAGAAGVDGVDKGVKRASGTSVGEAAEAVPELPGGGSGRSGRRPGGLPQRFQSVDLGAGGAKAASLEGGTRRHARLQRRATVETPNASLGRNDEGHKTVNQYVLFEELGKGAFGKVKRCFCKTDRQIYAVKIMKKSLLKKKRVGRFGNALQNVQKEVAIWKRLDHPNVVNLVEVVDDPEADKLYLFSEFVAGGAVMPDKTEADPIEERYARSYFCHLMNGLSYLHFEKIIHRDIKPGNLLITNDRSLKIADFGVANTFSEDDDVFRNSVGTAAFMAPEMTTGQEFRGTKIDIWACGITLYMMLIGRVPFMAPTLPQIYDQIQNKELTFPKVDGEEISEGAKDLIRQLLTRDPDKRPTIPEIQAHPWLKGEGAVAVSALPDAPMNRDEVTQGQLEMSVTRIRSIGSIVGAKRASVVLLTGARQRLAQSIKQVAVSQWYFGAINPVDATTHPREILGSVAQHHALVAAKGAAAPATGAAKGPAS